MWFRLRLCTSLSINVLLTLRCHTHGVTRRPYFNQPVLTSLGLFEAVHLCDGKLLLVTSNLLDALRRFRQSQTIYNVYRGTGRYPDFMRNMSHYEKGTLFWIDAICIDQENI